MMNTLELQARLKQAGFDPGPLDGQVGRKTIEAIKSFQAAMRLRVDGVVGPKTLTALLNVSLPPALSVEVGADQPKDFRVSSDCIDLIKAWEGLHDGNKQTTLLEPEPDPVGIYTVGWGHAMADAAGKWVRTKAGADAWMMRMFGKLAITRDEAKALLSQDVNEFLTNLRPLLFGKPYVQSQLDSMVSLAFNIGVRGFSGSTVLQRHIAMVPVSAVIDYKALEAASKSGRTSGPTEYAFAAWSKSAGAWLKGLFRRRVCEAMVYRGDSLAHALSVSQRL